MRRYTRRLLFHSSPMGNMRSILLVLICAWSSLAIARETPDSSGSDPFGTNLMLMPRPALRLNNSVADPCSEPMPKATLSLPDVVNLALCNNPKTREAWANSRVQAAQVGIGKANYLPSAELSASANHDLSGSTADLNQSNVGVTLSYLLYDFGSRSANLENARQLLAAANATQDSTVQTVFLAAVQDYYQVQATRASLDAALESERAAKESFAAAEARYNIGSATPADKLQAQAALNRITADGNLRNAQGTLANIIGLDANRTVLLAPANTAVMPDDFEGDVNALIEEARQLRPDLQAASALVKAAQANADAARASGSPMISLNASSNRYNNAGINSNSSTIGINLKVPIFSGYAPTYRVRAAEAQVDSQKAQFEQLRLQVALDVWTAYQHLTTATQSLRTSAVLLSGAEQSELDVLNAQSALASARQQNIQSTFNWNIGRATLAQAMGNLDAGLLQTLSASSGQYPSEINTQNHQQ